MKQKINCPDFSIRVFQEKYEHEVKYQSFYDGIYCILLNETIEISIIPKLSIINNLKLPEDIDNITNSVDAAVVSAYYSEYTVSINNDNQGEIIIPVLDSGNRQKETIIFWITDLFYMSLFSELIELEKLTYSVHGFIKKSEIKHQCTLELLERIIHSSLFRPDDLKIIES